MHACPQTPPFAGPEHLEVNRVCLMLVRDFIDLLKDLYPIAVRHVSSPLIPGCLLQCQDHPSPALRITKEQRGGRQIQVAPTGIERLLPAGLLL